MNKYPDFWSVLLGTGNHGFFFGYVVISYFAAFGMILILASKRDVDSNNTPVKWSWKFFWVNNALRFAASFFILPLFVRLLYQYTPPEWMLLMSIGFGFGFMYLAKLAQNIGLFTTNKASARVTELLNKLEEQQKDKP
jgi:hypothetical protein